MRICAEALLKQRLRQRGVLASHGRVLGNVAHPGKRADPQPVIAGIDLIETRKIVDVDEPARRDDAVFHPIQELSAAGDHHRARLRRRTNGVGERVRTLVSEGLHRSDLPRWRQPRAPPRRSADRPSSGRDCRS